MTSNTHIMKPDYNTYLIGLVFWKWPDKPFQYVQVKACDKKIALSIAHSHFKANHMQTLKIISINGV